MHLIGVHIVVYLGLTERTVTSNKTQSRGIRLPDQHFFPRILFYSHGETVFHGHVSPYPNKVQFADFLEIYVK